MDFIPSLTGYIQSLPTIATLRLCNRYGKGPACFVNRLPTELIDLIEGHVRVASRESAYEEFQEQTRCDRKTCACDRSMCHSYCTPERRVRHQHRISVSMAIRGNTSKAAISRDPPSIAAGTSGSLEDLEPQTCRHHANTHSYYLRTRDFRAIGHDAKVIQKHFGLDVWTHIRHSYDIALWDLRIQPQGSGLRRLDVNTREMTYPYNKRRWNRLFLMLPGSLSRISTQSEDHSLREDFMAALCPDRMVMRRFVRVCRLLGLRSSGYLRLLEMLAECNNVDHGTNVDLEKRMIAKIAESKGEILEQDGFREIYPHIAHVERPSSWESRMQTAWLKGASS